MKWKDHLRGDCPDEEGPDLASLLMYSDRVHNEPVLRIQLSWRQHGPIPHIPRAMEGGGLGVQSCQEEGEDGCGGTAV
jgi:hypothetical protein